MTPLGVHHRLPADILLRRQSLEGDWSEAQVG
jgi:hypothetical protein